jgi:hypothetical protein
VLCNAVLQRFRGNGLETELRASIDSIRLGAAAAEP